MQENLETNDITIDTKNDLMKILCENIMKENVWKKNCSECGGEQVYTSKYTLKNAILENKWCNKCRGNERKMVVPVGGWRKTCPKCGKEQTYCRESILEKMLKKNTLCNRCRGVEKRKHKSNILEKLCPKCDCVQKYLDRKLFNKSIDDNWLCRRCSTKESGVYKDKSFFKTDEYKIKMSDAIKSSEKNKNKFTEEFREKLRIAKLNQIKKLGTQHTYNPNACKFIDEYGKQNEYNFRHALNGGEIIVAGYSLDGYDKEKNVVFEYDEPKHNCLGVKKNDKIRERRIIEKIKPVMFIRYDEENNILYDIISGRRVTLFQRQ